MLSLLQLKETSWLAGETYMRAALVSELAVTVECYRHVPSR